MEISPPSSDSSPETLATLMKADGQVIVHCRDLLVVLYRPLSEDEARIHTIAVISCNENKREVCVVQNIANKQIDRTFLFDKRGLVSPPVQTAKDTTPPTKMMRYPAEIRLRDPHL